MKFNTVRKFVSGVVAASMVFTLSIPAFAANSSYSDLNDHWSKTYMEDLTARGYLKGYEDGTMRPENKITGAEALVLLSRFYKLDDEVKAEIYNDYGTAAKAAAGELTWASNSISICLAAGIISQSELKALNLSAAIDKERLAVYMVRAMKQSSEAEKLSDATLEFKDADNITNIYKGYVALLVQNDIIHGDDNGCFTPALSVTRAVVSTMISNSLKYIEKNKIELVIDKYAGYSKAEGIIASISGSSFTLTGMDGQTVQYSIPSGAEVKVDSAASSLTSKCVGCKASVKTKNGAVSSVSVTTTSTYLQGKLSSLSNSQGYVATLYNYATETSKSYKLTSDCYMEQDGSKVEFAGLTKNSFATVILSGDMLSAIYADSGKHEVTGTISAIEYGTTVTLTLKGNDNLTHVYAMDITNLPSITRGSLTITIDRLSKGDTVMVTTKSGLVKSISSSSTETTVKGTIQAITTTTSGTSWTISTSTGVTYVYTVDPLAAAYDADEKSMKISSFAAGDQVTLTVADTTVTGVQLISKATSNTSDKVTGKLLSSDSKTKVMTVLTSDNHLVYVTVSGNIFSTSEGNTVSFAKVEAGVSIAAYGEYTDSNAFKATSVIIE